jgi:ATP-dependent Clp protease ATP-binding subunit ClpA
MAQWDWQHSGARGIARLLERALLQPLAMALLTLEAGEKLTIELGEYYYDTGNCIK